MRIDRLDLTAFGCFEGHSLDLSHPGVHLVTGPNEAGKSTARRAIDQLLYGIDARSPYDFVHGYTAMRIGGLLRGEDGTELDVERRKGNKNTLTRVPDGQAVPEAEMLRMTAGVPEEEFRTVFAIDHAELRSGGMNLLAGQGEVGRALFESRSSARFGRVREALEAEMARLYGRGNAKKAVNEGWRTVADKRAELRDAGTAPADVAERRRAVDQAQAELAAAKEELAAARRAHRTLDELRRARPHLRDRDRLVARRTDLLAEGPVADTETAAALERLDTRATDRKPAEELDTAELARVREESAALHVDDALLAHAAEIDGLHADSQVVREVRDSAEKAARAALDARARASELLASARPGRRVDDADAFDLPAQAAERVDRLRSRADVLTDKLASLEAAVAGREADLAARREALDSLPPTLDTEPLRALLREAAGPLVADTARVTRDRADAEARAATIRTRHTLVGSPAHLPGPGETADHVQRRDKALDAVDLRREREREAADALRERRRELADVLDSDPPTEQRLRDARAARDTLFARVREGGDREATSAYEAAVAHADQVADALRLRAHEVALRQKAEHAEEAARETLDARTADVREAEERLAESERAWEELWRPSGIPAPAPHTAVELLAAYERLADADAETAKLRREEEQTLARVADLAGRLEAVLGGADAVVIPAPSAGAQRDEAAPDGVFAVAAPHTLPVGAGSPVRVAVDTREHATTPTGDPALRLAGLVSRGTERVESADAARAAHDRAADATRAAESEHADAARQLREAVDARAEWDRDWQSLVQDLGMPDAGPDDAHAAVTAVTLAAQSRREADDADRDHAAASARIAAFEARLAALPSDVVPHAADPHAAVDALHTALTAARDAHTRRLDLDAAETRQRTRLAAHAAARDTDLAEREGLVAACGVEGLAALRAAVQRAGELALLTGEIADRERRLDESGHIADDVVAGHADTDDADLEALIDEAALHVDALQKTADDAGGALTLAQEALRRVDASDRAARLREELSGHIAAVTDDSEAYVRAKLAHTVLLRCVEDYRARNQAPVLAAAGSIFQELTGGRFDELAAFGDDRGAPVLRARRAGARAAEVGVTDMSEGTLDQLYLALRLASLERYADEGRAMPLILDDIAMTFDDGRTRALLRVLDTLADRFQVVLFTHHTHLVDLARDALGGDRAHEHALTAYVPAL